MSNKALKDAARSVLAASDRLRDVDTREPQCDDEGMPYNPAAWLVWHEREFQPAYHRLRATLDNLGTELGYDVPRHPFSYRPLCEDLIAS